MGFGTKIAPAISLAAGDYHDVRRELFSYRGAQMRKRAFALLFVLAGCGAVQDPASAPRAVTPIALEPPPVYSLIGFRQEIGLSSQQVSALDSVAEGVRSENAPLVQQLRDRNTARAEQRGFIVVDSAGQPILEQLRENNRSAVAAVGEILNPQQRTTACRLFDQSRRDRMTRQGRQAQEARAREARTRARVDQIDTGTAAGGPWTWCTPAVPASSTSPVVPVETPPDSITPG
ncbi:hypothetical protein BH23GEM8_BH23GEM8_14640 [soil metagenome]